MATLLTPTFASGSGTAISVAKPTGASAGDYAEVYLWNNEQTFADNNTGYDFAFDAAAYNVTGVGSHRMAIRTLDGTEGSTFDFTNGGSVRWGAICLVWQGLHATPISVARTNGNSSVPAVTAGTVIGITTLNANDIHVACYGTDGANTNMDLNDVNYTLAAETNTAGGQRLSVAYRVIASPSATGTVAYTQSSESYMGHSHALRDGAAAADFLFPKILVA